MFKKPGENQPDVVADNAGVTVKQTCSSFYMAIINMCLYTQWIGSAGLLISQV